MKSNSFTCKLPIADSECLCTLNSEWTDESVQLLLLHNGQAWSGKFQFKEDEDLSELMDQFSLTEEKYLEETKSALTTQGGADNFGYTLENDKLTWKKYVSANMAIKFGYVALSKVSEFEIFEKIIDNNIQSNLSIKEKLLNTNIQKEILEKENADLKLKLNDLIGRKDEMEETLYSKFLVLLNEKKKKIKNLKKTSDCNEEEENTPDVEQRNSDHFSSETELDTDEEGNPSPSKVDVVGSKSNMEENIYIIPKKSKKSGKNENTASSSGVGKLGRHNRNASKSKTQNYAEASVSTNKAIWLKGGRRKFNMDSCVMGNKTDEKERNNSEEDAFMFPKRSKKVENKPPTSRKITYEESDEDTYLAETHEIEQDSDCTPEQISPVKNVSIKVEKTDEISLENKIIDKKNSSEEVGERKLNIKNENSKEDDEIMKDSIREEFSKSTLDMLNMLI